MQNTVLPQRRTLVLGAVLLAAAAALGVFSLTMQQNQCAGTGSGTSLVGGPFTMVSHTGEAITEKSFSGQYMLMFFGFTFCPQICPAELQVMSEALQQLGAVANQVTPVFVSIDPERDTPDLLASYVANFHPRLVGLTGNLEQVAAIAKAYRVYYAKVDNKDRPADYTMDHSSLIYLMAPDGSFRKHFSYTTNPAELAKSIKQSIENTCD